jgi:Zn-dependent M28 family amino/carboxypeptidase
MVRIRSSALVAAALFTSTLALAQPIPPMPEGAAAAAATIDQPVLESHIRFLADDLLEGRGPASRGDQLTQLYLSTQLKSLGYQPGAPEGGWTQPFDIVGVTTTAPATWNFRTSDGSQVSLARREDFVVNSGVQAERAVLDDAELVFVGYGIEAPEFEWNDYKDVDVRGKVLVMMNNDPDWDPDLFAGEQRLYYGRWTYKYEIAAEKGAAGAIIIHTTPSAGYPYQVVQTSWAGEQFELPPAGEPRVQIKAWMSEDATRRLLTAAGHDYDRLIAAARNRNFRPVPLGLTTTFATDVAISRKQTANVIGVLPGSDPELSQQAVVFTAHHDHLGIGEPNEAGDTIYNGARDNAAGTAAVLAIARAFAELPERPKRSIVIAFVGAEEQGLLGSAYYAQNPSFHPGRIAANINYDGGNIWGRTRDIQLIGYGKSSLDAIAKHFAGEQNRTVHPDEFPDRGFYYRSDQFSFAKIGVPALYFKTGSDFVGRPEGWGKEQMVAWETVNYHQPSDEIDESWNFDGMVDDTRLGFWAGLAVANSPGMPSWTPGDEFEAARLRALAEVNR